MNKIFLLIAFSFLLSCNSQKEEKQENTTTSGGDSSSLKADTSKREGIYTIEGDSVVIPPFQIEISLSPKASQRITSAKETIMVDVFLTGSPKDSAKAHFEEDGTYYVGSAKREINDGETASFDNVKIARSIYNELADKDFQFDVNVYSGRKSTGDNLLDVDFLSGKISSIVNKKTILNGKLIGE